VKGPDGYYFALPRQMNMAVAPNSISMKIFLDLLVVPILVRALFGEKLNALREEIGPHVARRVAFFLAACRHGGVI
jgi:hypothetical protein